MTELAALARARVWRHRSGVRLRPVPEQAMCLVYRRQPPALLALNLSSWLVFQLCDGCSEAEIETAYRTRTRATGGAGDANGAVSFALRQLLELGLIEQEEVDLP